MCVGGCDVLESSSHLLLHCKFFGISTVMPFDAKNHFNQFSFVGGAAKARRSILPVIWFSTV